MKILLDDVSVQISLFPFGVVRSIAHIRIGILTIFEKWQFFLPGQVFIASENPDFINDPDYLQYSANFVPSYSFLKKIVGQKENSVSTADCKILEHPWQIFAYNDWAIRQDFEMITSGRISGKIPSSSHAICPENIFIEPGVKIYFSVLNAEKGPIYIGRDAEIMEGSLLRGPVSVGANSVLKMGAKIYGATSIGPNCLGGGEIKNSVMMGFSNKAHDGYLGDSVIGEWCNLGAGSSNSNLKNNASEVKIWSKMQNDFVTVGTKCGLLMGDYSRCSINTSFNTGTIAGICCNIFGNSFPPKFIDNFAWGDTKYIFEKAIDDISNWKKLKNEVITGQEIQSLKNIYYQQQ